MTHENNAGSRFCARDLAYIGIGAALIAVCAWISIPTAVPFTMQTFAIFLLLRLLGGRRGTLSILVYLMLGAVGLPVFAQFTGGIGIMLGSTGGYMLGFVLIGLVYLCSERLFGGKNIPQIAALVVGLALCYAFGTAWFMVVYTRENGAVAFGTVLSWCVLPFIIPDLVKLTLAVLIARRTAPALHLEKA